jgi:hypothetical protein
MLLPSVNDINVEGARNIAEALKVNTTVLTIDLGGDIRLFSLFFELDVLLILYWQATRLALKVPSTLPMQ